MKKYFLITTFSFIVVLGVIAVLTGIYTELKNYEIILIEFGLILAYGLSYGFIGVILLKKTEKAYIDKNYIKVIQISCKIIKWFDFGKVNSDKLRSMTAVSFFTLEEDENFLLTIQSINSEVVQNSKHYWLACYYFVKNNHEYMQSEITAFENSVQNEYYQTRKEVLNTLLSLLEKEKIEKVDELLANCDNSRVQKSISAKLNK